MTIDEVCTISEALFYLSGLTKRPWSMSEFTREVIRRRLPVYARAPSGVSIVSRKRVNGRLVVTPQPSMVAEYVTLLQDEIEELAASPGPQIITDRPAWLFGDLPYQSWGTIVAFRQGNHRVLGNREVDHGEWMGQSDEYFFSKPVQVTAETTLVVPRHTIAELALSSPIVSSKPADVRVEHPAVPSAPSPDEQAPALAGETRNRKNAGEHSSTTIAPPPVDEATPASVKPARQERTPNSWDMHDSRRLLEESLMPGNTHAVLAKRYGVSRQFIGKQLTRARDLFGSRKPSPFDVLGPRSRKK